jgi:hypothetical protein
MTKDEFHPLFGLPHFLGFTDGVETTIEGLVEGLFPSAFSQHPTENTQSEILNVISS